MLPDDKLAKLKQIGFKAAGAWTLVENEILCELIEHSTASKVLYAFVVDEQLMYVGKTTQTLRKRMAGYRKPGGTQSTNINNHRNIRDCLANGRQVEVYALPDNGLSFHGPFHLDVAAGLEDSLIRDLSPPWNRLTSKPLPPIPQSRSAKIMSINRTDSVSRPRRETYSDEFRDELSTILADGGRNGHSFIEISAGDLHRRVGGYPAPNHRMPICCDVMRAAMFDGDIVVSEPPKGKGASLTIRFVLPRKTS